MLNDVLFCLIEIYVILCFFKIAICYMKVGLLTQNMISYKQNNALILSDFVSILKGIDHSVMEKCMLQYHYIIDFKFTAPIPGQLIPMAVPLGDPRMDQGLAVSAAMAANPGTLTFDQCQVSADRNVALVSVGVDEKQPTQLPELGKQVLILYTFFLC